MELGIRLPQVYSPASAGEYDLLKPLHWGSGFQFPKLLMQLQRLSSLRTIKNLKIWWF